jgi:pyrroloquinoline-quinone synthase
MPDQLTIEIEKQSILKHPFYQLWNEGKLTTEALRVYAQQYYHFVDEFPHLLERMLENCEDSAVRSMIEENLAEERKHPALWLAFAESLGLTQEDVISSETLPETERSLQTFRSLMNGSTLRAAASLLTYEAQVPEVAKKKMEGLMRFYNINTPEALEFFRVHMTADLDHVKVWKQILHDATDNPHVVDAAKKSLTAQWRLLDGVLRISQLPITCGEQPGN